MQLTKIHTLDLIFQGRPGTIAAYLLPHTQGAALVETGPGSTIPALIEQLKNYNYLPSDITDVFLTHIHLDHAGAAGWFAQQGATIHVHPMGAPHLENPEKLLLSAGRIYGSQMSYLWGEYIPVLKDRLHVMQDGEVFQCSNLSVRAIDVPGHAYHQYAYLVDDTCFTGDIGGIRVNNLHYLSIPMPPPEFHLEKWRKSIHRLISERPKRIAPTHFGVYDDAEWHLNELLRALDRIDIWMQEVLPADPPIETLRQMFTEYEQQRASQAGLSNQDVEAQQIANPSFMSADGILRYWKKYRSQST